MLFIVYAVRIEMRCLGRRGTGYVPGGRVRVRSFERSARRHGGRARTRQGGEPRYVVEASVCEGSRCPALFVLLVGMMLLLVPTAHAQEGGAFVSGSVVDASTFRPLAGAQIVVAGTTRGTLTDPQGRFRVTDLAGGTVTLRVQMIG